MNAAPRGISVIIPYRNAAATLERCLAALTAIAPGDYGPLEVIAVDDASSDGSPVIAARHNVVSLATPAPRGPGWARNAGAHAARFPLLAFLDADCVVDQNWFDRMIPLALAAAPAAVASQYKGHIGGAAIQHFAHHELKFREPHARRRVVSASTCNLICPRDAFFEVGEFSTDPRLTGGEDLEFTLRYSRKFPILWEPAGGVTHHFRPDLRGYLAQQVNYARSAVHATLATRRLPRGHGAGAALHDTGTLREIAATGALLCAPVLAVAPLPGARLLLLLAAIDLARRNRAFLRRLARDADPRLAAFGALVIPLRNAAWIYGAVKGAAEAAVSTIGGGPAST